MGKIQSELDAMPLISDILAALDGWAPEATQQSYDNAGLQVGDLETPVTHCVIALDLTPAVVEEAVALNAELIITHHPLIFRPLKSITTTDWHGSLVLRLAQAGISLYAIHTNLDAALSGVSFALAEQLGLRDVRFLRPIKNSLLKLVTFVPSDHFDIVREALAHAGAGQIGNYDACAFVTEGTGFFHPNANANPYVGEGDGQLESTPELRIEVEVSRARLQGVLAALHSAHPYEEVAYDLYPVEQPSTQIGMGAIGTLEHPESLRTFLQRIAEALETNGIRYVGDTGASVHRVAVCGGSGSDLIPDAMRAGADAFLTADISYHRFFEVLDVQGFPRMALIDVMHYETEACAENLLAGWLHQQFPDAVFRATETRTSPIQTFVNSKRLNV